MLKLRCAVLFLALVSCFELHAQFGEIYGIVTDAEDAPVLFCNHTLLIGGETITQTAGDDKGKYYFSGLNPGTYTMITSTVEYAADTSLVIVKRDKQVLANIKMGVNKLNVLFVYGNKVMDGTSGGTEMEIYGPEELRHAPIGSIAEVPKMSPKVYDRKGDGGSISIAGSRENANLFIIDGVRVDGNFSLPMGAVAEVRVITGGIPARYGDFTGGVIEVFTKQSILIN